ncbi:MAG: disulfide bond formation protein B [Paracoccaceae bacterium]
MKSSYIINTILFLSIFSLLFVFILQYEYGIIPCKLCIWQRLPHFINIIIILKILSSTFFSNYLSILGLLNMIFAFLLALYHYGLEQKLWNNVFSCGGTLDLKDLSTEELLKKINNTPITNCEIEAWNFLNLSLSGWNMILTIFMIIAWFFLIKSKRYNYETNSASQ